MYTRYICNTTELFSRRCNSLKPQTFEEVQQSLSEPLGLYLDVHTSRATKFEDSVHVNDSDLHWVLARKGNTFEVVISEVLCGVGATSVAKSQESRYNYTAYRS